VAASYLQGREVARVLGAQNVNAVVPDEEAEGHSCNPSSEGPGWVDGSSGGAGSALEVIPEVQ